VSTRSIVFFGLGANTFTPTSAAADRVGDDNGDPDPVHDDTDDRPEKPS
jgi:hypothetical protein